MAKVIAIVGTCVWGYSVVWNKLMVLDSSLDRVQHEGTLLGDLSARMMHLEKFAEQSKVDLDHLLEMQDAPITSDHQQFERIRYLEKELDRMRDKLENAFNERTMRWVNYLCYLSRAVVALLWGRFLKACLVISSKPVRTSMILKWREKLVRLIISLDYKLNSLKAVLGSLFLLLVVFLLLSGCLRSALVSSSAPSSPPQKSSHSPTQTEKASTKYSSDSSVGKRIKSHSLFLLDTSALWDAR